MSFKFFRWATFCLTLLLPQICSANLSLSEYRLYFDGRTKNNSLMIRNTSDKNLDFKLSLTHKDMTEEGSLIDATPKQVEGRSAAGMLRFSPRRGSIAPKDMQAIRMTVRKKAELPAGEYRAVLKIVASEAPDPNAVGITIRPKISYSVPVIVRHGQLEADSQLINPQLISQNGRPTIMFWQTLTGNRSLYGNFELTDSNNLPVGEVTNVAVYTPLSRRKVYISLQQPVVGPLTLKYTENPQYGGNIELAIPVNIQ
ncbi:hypothetical protein H5119_19215 [Pseudoalteromonas sp. SG45-5]|uniref:hypothetical protein n=1 Tax=unclassified Pseudoalteromonas TaxID=194690 RepID=UPI00110B7E05|nr:MULTISPECIES: hypothetical protein [unclassified Pseudoalteromonas]MBB1387625.1 hypothetical protein [Pseudoalteromonas sp. SG45-5]MBB1395705.1 hypothetical protein [Pseudoalteromonas sp. SG44-4]MBB1448869.1 hypothetical protein [Pseudoalteromonas sp. SG41-6]TMO09945.1 hypothetical protein CWB66_01180 [Pseudoalteromonas sp. S558]